jgi:hypothetical protein
MKNIWAFLSMVNALAIVGIMLYHANRMGGKAPPRVRVCVSFLTAASAAYAWMAITGAWFSWPDVVFSTAVLTYVLFNRRKPT